MEKDCVRVVPIVQAKTRKKFRGRGLNISENLVLRLVGIEYRPKKVVEPYNKIKTKISHL